MRSILDKCMERNLDLTKDECKTLGDEFIQRLELADNLFDSEPFELELYGRTRPSVGVYDGIMVALDRLWNRRDEIIAAKQSIQQAYGQLIENEGTSGKLTGSANTSQDVKDRLSLFENMILEAL